MALNKLFQWLRGARAAPPPGGSGLDGCAPMPGAHPPGSRIDRLDLQTAVIHHLEWCVAFNDHLSHIHQAESPPVGRPPGAAQSELGQWLLRSAARAPGGHPAFAELLREHRHFHALAAEALQLATEGRMDLASTLLNTDFERSRLRVLALLREMQQP